MPALKKIKLEDGKTSLLWEGYESNLPNMALMHHETPEEKEVIEDIQDVKVGKQLVLYSLRDYHVTSVISEILESSPEKVVFRTQTSIYELTP